MYLQMEDQRRGADIAWTLMWSLHYDPSVAG